MTAILNEDLKFSSIPPEDGRAFLRLPVKMRFSAGTKFYKWTSFPLVGGKGITPWWSFVIRTVLPDGSVAEGFRDSERYAHRLGVSHRSYQQVRGAVSERFNNAMENLLVVQLDANVWGFAGTTSGQPEFKNPALDNVYLIGGKGQVYIPNLTLKHLHRVAALG